MKIRLIICCRGTRSGMIAWRKQTGITDLPLVADEAGSCAAAMRFPRCVWNTCRMSYFREGSSKNVIAKVPTMLLGIAVPVIKKVVDMKMAGVMMQDGGTHDIHQMGGTVLMAGDGKVLWRHVTTESTDRPSAEVVLAACGKHE